MPDKPPSPNRVITVYLSDGAHSTVISEAGVTLGARLVALRALRGPSTESVLARLRSKEDSMRDSDSVIIDADPLDLTAAALVISAVQALIYGSLNQLVVVTTDDTHLTQLLAMGDSVDVAALTRHKSAGTFTVLRPGQTLRERLVQILDEHHQS